MLTWKRDDIVIFNQTTYIMQIKSVNTFKAILTNQGVILKSIFFRHALPDGHEHGLKLSVDDINEFI